MFERVEWCSGAAHYPHRFQAENNTRGNCPALVIEPAVKLADQPTGALDTATARRLALLRLADAGRRS